MLKVTENALLYVLQWRLRLSFEGGGGKLKLDIELTTSSHMAPPWIQYEETKIPRGAIYLFNPPSPG